MPRDLHKRARRSRPSASQTVMQAALANGFYIPYFCWHPELSVAGNCRICCVQVEGRSWVEIACNMPVTEGLRVLTDSEPVKAYRKSIMQLMTLNHPVDCGICDKAGECTLQDYHYEYNGAPSISRDAEGALDQVPSALRAHRARQRALHPVLALRALHARDLEVERARHRRSAATPRSCAPPRTGRSTPIPYSDNVIDLCPVGALLSRPFLYKSRVWYLEPTPSVCPGCARGCTVHDLAPQGRMEAPRARPAARTRSIERVTPLREPGRSTARGSATRGATSRRSSSGRARCRRCRRASRSTSTRRSPPRGA